MDVTRRALLAAAVGGVTATSGCMSILYGGTTTGQPTIPREQSTDTARTVTELKGALASSGATVWIPAGVTIDLRGEGNIFMAKGVSLASAASGDKPPGTIYQPGYVRQSFYSPRGNVHISGVRFVGPNTEQFEGGQKYRAAALNLRKGAHRVDACEFLGWPRCGISVGTADTRPTVHISRSAFHHNRMSGLGYGIQVIGGRLLAEYNSFNANRHAIAASGFPGSGYEARGNIVGPETVHHIFDVHSAGGTNHKLFGTSTDAGEYVYIHRNVVLAKRSNAVGIRGVPRQAGKSAVVGNWFAEVPEGDPPMNVVHQQIDRPVGKRVEPRSLSSYRNVVVRDNQFGDAAVQRGLSALRGSGQNA